MRIAISDSRRGWGGATTAAVTLARGLSERGHHIIVLCRPESAILPAVEGAVPVEAVLRSAKTPPRSIVGAAFALRRHRIEAVVSSIARDRRITMPAARLAGAAAIARWPGATPVGTGYQGWVDRLATHYVANSNATRRVLLESAAWLAPERVSVVPNGVDTERFVSAIPAPLGLPPNALAFGYIGRMDDEKGVPELAEAWPSVKRALPDAHLVMVGAGPIDAARARLAGQPDVRFLGYRSDVAEILHAIDLLVVPSRTEAFGIAAAEAMAAGVPVIATDVDGLPELVRDGVDGVLVPARAPSALADAMIALGHDPARRRLLGAAGARRIRERFARAGMLDGYEAVIARVLEARRSRFRGDAREADPA